MWIKVIKNLQKFPYKTSIHNTLLSIEVTSSHKSIFNYKDMGFIMKKQLMVLVMLTLVLAISINTAWAGDASVGGTIGAGDPQIGVIYITEPNCTGQDIFMVAYDSYPFTVSADGHYTVNLASTADFASIYIFEGNFDPSNPLPTCIVGWNDNPVSFSIYLTAGVQYIAVPFDDTYAQSGGDYTLSVSGPGTVTFGNTHCPYPLPVSSVVYDIPAGAPTFFAADLGSQTNFNLPAGTWYVSEFTGDFAKVWISCEGSPVYVPANAVGAAR